MLATLVVMMTLEKVAADVHVIRHADSTPDWPNGNTTVIVGERGLLVVDSGYLPSVARADIAEIKRLTKKPVRWLLNTHWHYDHNNGNAVYRKEFPGVEIIAHAETRRLMDANCARYARAVVAVDSPTRKALAEAKAKGVPAAELADRERELAELAGLEVALPTLTFRDELVLDLGGGREARILNFGRGNTPGDAVVYLPAERVVVAGDLVVAPVPYAWNSYPVDWVTTLRRLRALEAGVLVPGHGPIMRDDGYVASVQALLEAVLHQTRDLSRRGLSLDDIRKAIDLESFHRAMVAGDAKLDEVWKDSIMRALVERALQSTRGGL